jgi:hypothetical protein
MENSWVMLARVLRVVPVESQAEHAVVEEPEHAAGGEGEQAAQAQAEHPAVGGAEDDAAWEGEDDAAEEAEIVAQALLEERVVGVDAVPAAAAANNLGEPGFIFSVAPPPRVVFLTARHSAHPDPPRRHTYPYFIASGPFCLLAHFAASPHYGMDFRRDLTGRRHLIVVRHFRRAGGQIVATPPSGTSRASACSATATAEDAPTTTGSPSSWLTLVGSIPPSSSSTSHRLPPTGSPRKG